MLARRLTWLPAALAAVKEELVAPRALAVLVDAVTDRPVPLADVLLAVAAAVAPEQLPTF